MMKQIMASIGAMALVAGPLSIRVAAQAPSDTTKGGKVTAPRASGVGAVPRTPDGQPDLQGLWMGQIQRRKSSWAGSTA
jgi:hypothetical protein